MRFARWQITALALVVSGGAAVVTGSLPGDGATQDIVLTTLHGSAHGYESYGFDIKASSVKGLYPGARKPILLKFANPYAFPIKVTRVEGKTTATNRRKCAPQPSNLTVEPYGGRLPMTIPPRTKKDAGQLNVYMPNSVSNDCQGVTFTLRINGHATKAGR